MGILSLMVDLRRLKIILFEGLTKTDWYRSERIQVRWWGFKQNAENTLQSLPFRAFYIH